ncbi:RHS repeat domain-containing protein [Litoreibacter meonggei]|uniref:RHS repeat domain-containing protein n=1 Tax=Litoreibacter meonggei TaxID=1049199 RepID=UPI00147542D7|nr:RHS repeat protein [Litoreibacter meonggei]
MTKTEVASDWISPKDDRFRIKRYYRSDDKIAGQHHLQSPIRWFGGIWAGEFNAFLATGFANNLGASSPDYVFNRGDGFSFLFDGLSGSVPLFPEKSYELSVDATGRPFVADGKGTKWTFEDTSDDKKALEQIEWSDGYSITFLRDAAGQVAQFEDNRGQVAQLTWVEVIYDPAVGAVPMVSKVEIDPEIGATGFTPSVELNYVYSAVTSDGTIAQLDTVHIADVAQSTSELQHEYDYVASTTHPLLTTIHDGRLRPNGTDFPYAEFTYQTTPAAPGFSEVGPKVVSTQHFGGAERHEFDQVSDLLTKVTGPLGKVADYNYVTPLLLASVNGQTIRIPLHKTLQTIDGLPTSNCLGTTLTPSFGTSSSGGTGLPLGQVERNGASTVMSRNAAGLVTQINEDATSASPRITTLTWDPVLRLPTQRQTDTLIEDFTYSAAGQLLTYIQTDNLAASPTFGTTREWDYTYSQNALGLSLLTTVDGPGLVANGVIDETSYTYDPNGNLDTVTDANGHVTDVLTRNKAGQPLHIAQPDGNEWTMTYDIEGRVLTSSFLPQGGTPQTQSYSYDEVGQVVSMTNPLGNTWVYAYDEARRLVSTTSPEGELASYTYDNMGNRTRTEHSNVSAGIAYFEDTQYDELGRLLKILGANGQITEFSHDVEDNLATITDPQNLVTTRGFDALNRLISEVDRNSGQVGLAHNVDDQMTSYSDQRGLVTSQIYNGFGDLIQEISPDKGTTTYTYNSRGLMASKTDARGIFVQYDYDNSGRPTKIDYPPGGKGDSFFYYDHPSKVETTGKPSLTVVDGRRILYTYAYYADGPIFGQRFKYPNKLAFSQYVKEDTAGNVSWIQYPSTRRVYYEYDDDNRITAIKQQAPGTNTITTIVDQITHLPNGPVASMQFADGFTRTFTYDQSYRLTDVVDTDGVTTLQDTDYGYSTRDNLTSTVDNLLLSQSETFTYEAREFLASAVGDYGTLDYSYDLVGNRISRMAAGVTDSYSYGATNNRLDSVSRASAAVRTFTHDAAGNVTYDDRSGTGYGYDYDAAGRMDTFSIFGVAQEEYQYDAVGQQVVRRLTQDGVEHHSFFGPGGQRISEYEVPIGTKTKTLLREYVWLGDIPVAVIENSQVYYVRADHIGKPIFATDSLGAKVWEATYLPFGGVHTSTGTPMNLRFPGQWFQSESGLHQNWMRDYDPTLGRYIQSDPLGLVDGSSVYGYAMQNPGRYADPSGEQSSPFGFPRKLPNSSGGAQCGDPCESFRERVRQAKAQKPKKCVPNDSVITLFYKTKQWGELCTARKERDAYCPPINGLPGDFSPEGETNRRVKDCSNWTNCNSLLRRKSFGLFGSLR